MIRIALILALAVQAGCGSLSLFSPPPEQTLADLQPAVVPAAAMPVPAIGLEELSSVYRDALADVRDPEARLAVRRRLADIDMLQGEAALARGDSGAVSLTEAIAAYQSLLAEHPDMAGRDQLLYQLSKAHELAGDDSASQSVLAQLAARHPDSPHALEAQFRGAESRFAAADYRGAAAGYGRVVAAGEGSAYYLNALYMQGWSRFKQGLYPESIESFTGTLDQLLAVTRDPEALERADRELARDCLRVLAVGFSYLDGADTIANLPPRPGGGDYEYLLYESLGQLYLAQERYRDSAETYRVFTRRFPASQLAHRSQLRVIDAYQQGGFPGLIVEEKRHYVEAFGVRTAYWSQIGDDTRGEVAVWLKRFLGELAAYHHALAQAPGEQGAGPDAEALAHYRSAAGYYQNYIDSFPQDPAVPDMGFLLAESRFEAGEYRAAIVDYEWVAYFFPDHARAADAGYAAILAHRELAGTNPVDGAALRRQRLDSELLFAGTFIDDSRAPAVLGHAAGELLQLGEYQRAVIVAATLARRPEPVDPDLLAPAYLVMGHAHFELAQYDSAREAYQGALTLMPADDRRRGDTIERVAASLYRQAEEWATARDHAAAAEQFARVIATAPRSGIRINAQFDAANQYILAGDIAEGNRLLIDFRQRFPRHELAAAIPAKLVSNYELMGDWGSAAGDLDTLGAADPGSEQSRQALYLSAQYYEKAGQLQAAMERYRRYARDWPRPVENRVEAINRLAELSPAGSAEHRRWLLQIVEVHEAAGKEQNDRTIYLAARASSSLADSAYREYGTVQLVHPLSKSLKRKKTSMKRALAAYERTHAYGVKQFSTRATFRMARIYEQLSEALLDSQRPEGLDPLALEQYEIMLEEQAYPFEETAIAIHESNTRRSWEGLYDEWVRRSFAALGELLPARYGKAETLIAYSEEIY